MAVNLLLPPKFKWIGLALFVPSVVLGILVIYYDFTFHFLNIKSYTSSGNIFNSTDYNLTNEVALTGVILGLLMMAFAREKQEDEFISKVRLESLQWAVLINYVLLLAATWLINGWNFIEVMMYNMLTVLVIFIIRFNYVLFRSKQTGN
ncbi:hypothetical protein [Terrimonas alba]|uniref:hypothetical protein n=1 Tax=Terrimonas alba TaxID=3349636 RepID=UPI0035F472EC